MAGMREPDLSPVLCRPPRIGRRRCLDTQQSSWRREVDKKAQAWPLNGKKCSLAGQAPACHRLSARDGQRKHSYGLLRRRRPTSAPRSRHAQRGSPSLPPTCCRVRTRPGAGDRDRLGIEPAIYGPAVTEIIGLEPSERLVELASRQQRAAHMPVTFLRCSAEAIPLDAASVDTVVTTWTVCSIPDAATALGEMRRVLKPGGCLLFVEHGRAPDRGIARLQDWLTPAWKPLAGGCHLNRPIGDLIARSGFRVSDLRTGYVPGPRPFTFMYEGAASRS
jgi:SAM-dependent methyltransferase